MPRRGAALHRAARRAAGAWGATAAALPWEVPATAVWATLRCCCCLALTLALPQATPRGSSDAMLSAGSALRIEVQQVAGLRSCLGGWLESAMLGTRGAQGCRASTGCGVTGGRPENMHTTCARSTRVPERAAVQIHREEGYLQRHHVVAPNCRTEISPVKSIKMLRTCGSPQNSPCQNSLCAFTGAPTFIFYSSGALATPSSALKLEMGVLQCVVRCPALAAGDRL